MIQKRFNNIQTLFITIYTSLLKISILQGVRQDAEVGERLNSRTLFLSNSAVPRDALTIREIGSKKKNRRRRGESVFTHPSRVSSLIATAKIQVYPSSGDLHTLTRQWLGKSQVQVSHLFLGESGCPSNKAAAKNEGGTVRGRRNEFFELDRSLGPGTLPIADLLGVATVKGLTRDWD